MLFSRKSETRNGRSRTSISALERVPERLRGRERTPPSDRVPAPESRLAPCADEMPSQSFVDASLTIVGDLHSAGDVRIDGRICGNVRCAQLILGRDAVITGSVVSQQAIVRGRIIGTIRAPVVVIQESAHVESDITYCLLAIDDGAFFEGAAHRRDNPLDVREPQPVVAQALPPAPASAATSGAITETPAQEASGPVCGEVSGEPPERSNGKASNGTAAAVNGHNPTGCDQTKVPE